MLIRVESPNCEFCGWFDSCGYQQKSKCSQSGLELNVEIDLSTSRTPFKSLSDKDKKTYTEIEDWLQSEIRRLVHAKFKSTVKR